MSNTMNFLDETPFWVEFPESRKVPKGAIVAGNYNGTPLYIGRAVHGGAMTPGSVFAAQGELHHSWGCNAHTKTNFEILVGGSSRNWIATGEGKTPENAFSSGLNENQESLYIGRVKDSHGNVIIGKVQPSHRVCYIPEIRTPVVCEEPKEVAFKSYELFVI